MKNRLPGFRSMSLCCSFPKAAGWWNCSAPSQVCGFVPFSVVWIGAVLIVFRCVTAPWGPLADATRKKILRLFQPSPGYWTGFSKLQGEDLQVSSENSVYPQLPFFWVTFGSAKFNHELRPQDFVLLFQCAAASGFAHFCSKGID